jgi:Ni,Fe-hydrogenase III large subunit
MTTGRVTPALAAQLGLTRHGRPRQRPGLDLRCNHPGSPTPNCTRAMATHNGDVAARVAVRFDEVLESLRLIRELCAGCRSAHAAAD